MKIGKIVLTSVVFFCTASMLNATTIAHTWVSGANGSDTNPCTRTAPCATFAAAAANTTAGGIISVADPGDFGPVDITKSLTIDGTNGGSITQTNSTGIGEVDAVTIGVLSAVNVTLRNLTLNGFGQGFNGIWAGGPVNLTIENCLIENFKYSGVAMAGNEEQNVVIRNTVIVGGQSGFNVFESVPTHATLQNVTIQGASNAVSVGSGITEISNSVLTQNTMTVLAGSGATVSVDSSMLTMNWTAVCADAGATIRLVNNDIFDNENGVFNCGGHVMTNDNNRESGNIKGNSIHAADVSHIPLF